MDKTNRINTDISFFSELTRILTDHLFIEKNIDIPFLYNQLNKSLSVVQETNILNYGIQMIPQNGKVNLLGIDLPSWFGNYEKSQKRIMIIGIDPMRNKKDFLNLKADFKKDIVFGTPYSFHMENMWNNTGKYKYYTQFVTSLVNNNFIYLTDIYKTFFYYDNLRSYKYFEHLLKQKNNPQNKSNQGKNIFVEILKKEISTIQPDIIITLGNISYNQLTKNASHLKVNSNLGLPSTLSSISYDDIQRNKQIPIYKLVHLAARKKNLEDFRNKHLTNEKSEDFGIILFDILKKYNAVD